MPAIQEHPLHLEAKVRKDAQNRLLSAKGHLEGILKMLEGDPYCVDVLKQISAVQGALDKVGSIVLRSHLEHHVASAAQRGDTDKMVDELMEVLKYR
ncbi:MAG: metal-sensitive transcriptional regulator [Thermaceae bacterium]|nr:metal-sensitive transcriptional regulator [Thermaceae bacterium]